MAGILDQLSGDGARRDQWRRMAEEHEPDDIEPDTDQIPPLEDAEELEVDDSPIEDVEENDEEPSDRRAGILDQLSPLHADDPAAGHEPEQASGAQTDMSQEPLNELAEELERDGNDSPEPPRRSHGPSRKTVIIIVCVAVALALAASAAFAMMKLSDMRHAQACETARAQAAEAVDDLDAVLAKARKYESIDGNTLEDPEPLEQLLELSGGTMPKTVSCPAGDGRAAQEARKANAQTAETAEAMASKLNKLMRKVDESRDAKTLATARDSLAKAIDKARRKLIQTNGKVEDDKTRAQLQSKMEAARKLTDSKDPKAMDKLVGEIDSAIKAVDKSMKAKSDRQAREKQEAERKAQEEREAQAQAEAEAQAQAQAQAQQQYQNYSYTPQYQYQAPQQTTPTPAPTPAPAQPSTPSTPSKPQSDPGNNAVLM